MMVNACKKKANLIGLAFHFLPVSTNNVGLTRTDNILNPLPKAANFWILANFAS